MLNFSGNEKEIINFAESRNLLDAIRIVAKMDSNVTISLLQDDSDGQLLFMLEMKEFDLNRFKELQKPFVNFSKLAVLPSVIQS